MRIGACNAVAIMVGSGVGAKKGVLFKTASALEATGKTDFVVLDKTGTVTQGKPQVTDLHPVPGVAEAELLQTAAALEEKSEHPLAHAIRARAVETGRNMILPVRLPRCPATAYRVRLAGKPLSAATPP